MTGIHAAALQPLPLPMPVSLLQQYRACLDVAFVVRQLQLHVRTTLAFEHL